MFEGIYPPIPTPFDDAQAVSLDRLAANIEKWNATGLAGYVVMGSNGEAPHIAPQEAAQLVATVRKSALPDMKVIAGSGQLSTHATVDATKRAADAGADAVLVITPHYYKNAMSADALKQHFFTVADAASVPVLIYNVPANTAFNMPVAIVSELAAHDNILGIKDSAGNIDQLAEWVRLTQGQRFEVLSGNFSALLPAMTLGIKGAIIAVANVAAQECVSMFEAARAAQWESANEIHMRLLPIARALTSGYGVPGLKAALDLLGYFGGEPRKPLLSVSGSVQKEIENILRETGLLQS